MRKAARTNLILAILAVTLGALAWWQVEREIDAREPPLSTIDTAAVTRIQVRCAGCVERRFSRGPDSRGPDGWRMTLPYEFDADPTAIARLLAIAAAPVRLREPVEHYDLAKIGLDPPTMTLALDATRIDIGTTDALRGERYVRDGARIARVPDRFSPFLVATPESELDRHLVPRPADVRSVRVDGVESPSLIPAWREVRATRITPADASPSIGSRRIDLDFGDGTSRTWQLLRRADEWIARRADPALDFHLAAADASRLVGAPAN